MTSPRKLRHRPSDDLIHIRERGLPWLLAVFLVLFILLTLLLVYFVITTRDVYLSQKDIVEKTENEQKMAEAMKYDDEKEAIEELEKYKKRKEKENVHVDIVPIVNRKTGEPDNSTVTQSTVPITTTVSTTTTAAPTTTEATTTTTVPPTTTVPLTTAVPTTTTVPPTTIDPWDTTIGRDYPDDDLEGVDIEEYEETTVTPTTTVSPPTVSVVTVVQATVTQEEVITTTVPFTTSPPATVQQTTLPLPTVPQPTEPLSTVSTTVPLTLKARASFSHQSRSHSTEFESFAISTHHEKCSEIGKKIVENGGNAVDATIAAEFCISVVHPHSTGPGFGAIMVIHSKKKSGTYTIDGRERAPRHANQNTFVTNPSIAHIGYSSTGIPGWISVLWTAYKQFGSGHRSWQQLIQPTIDLLDYGSPRMDRLLYTAFESRKNHVLHEKSFGSMFKGASREMDVLMNEEYGGFLRNLSVSSHAEHDFYGGNFSRIIVEEMKKRGGLISKYDLDSYSSIVTRAEVMDIGEYGYLTGPHLPYGFPILRKVFEEVFDKYSSENPEELIDYYVDFAKLLQKADQMKLFIGDDLFEPEVKPIIDKWQIPVNFKPEDEVELNSKKKSILSYSRILALDDSGNAVNFMSTNTVPFGSVRRSPTLGFVWNNAMSSFDVYCRHDINCVKGGKRPAVWNVLPTIFLDREKNPKLLLSPTFSPLASTSSIIIQSTLMNMTTADSIDHPRIYSTFPNQTTVEAGIPNEIYRNLWQQVQAKFTHPTNPTTVIHKTSSSGKPTVICDFRQTTRICYPNGI